MVSAEQVFLEFSVAKLRQYLARIHSCLALLNDQQIWQRPSPASNSIGNLCLHLAGNVRQWILHGIAGEPDTRRRDEEFAARGGIPKAELLARLDDAVHCACQHLESLPPARLLASTRPQNYDVTVLEAIYHVVEHFSGHTGQIIAATKAMTGADLGFYRHLSGAAEPPPPPAGHEIP
ncbi:MAG: hypothetical protein KatS3mg005_4022 [Bryobacteraceae bacterium]|nr:MAG: hypothetical protein KatS3mg005_4022 [Bryobacteraceae bacterium]